MRSVLVAGLLVVPLSATAVETVDPRAVDVGTRGVCVTEVENGELVEIPLTVLGGLDGTVPEGESLLVRLEDPRFEELGIASGMSGSPVYVDGRLLGALAYGWSFSTEPIGGVTPFDRMRHLAEPELQASGGAGRRPRLAELVEARGEGALGELLLGWLTPSTEPGSEHLPLAVALGGIGADVGVDWMAESWRRLGWRTAPGGASRAEARGPLQPGSMVAGILVRGDATVAVGGTVTALEDGRVWAFGHPFLGGGTLVMPMARASVVAMMPNLASPFKVFNVGQTVGAFRVDRSHGVLGELGAAAAMVPITVEVDRREYRFECVRHPVLLPLMTSYVTYASHAARGRTFGDQTVRVRLLLSWEDGRRASVEEVFAGADGAALAAELVSMVTAFLSNSSFSPPSLASVGVELETVEALRRGEILEAVPERVTVAPGERLAVRVRIRPHRGGELVRTLSVRVPSGVDEGRLDLVVADGTAWDAYDVQMRPPRTASFDDELRFLERLVPASRLVAVLEQRAPGIAAVGGGCPVPIGVLLALQSGLGPNLAATSHQVVARVEDELEFPVSGAQRIPLKVVRDGLGVVRDRGLLEGS